MSLRAYGTVCGYKYAMCIAAVPRNHDGDVSCQAENQGGIDMLQLA